MESAEGESAVHYAWDDRDIDVAVPASEPARPVAGVKGWLLFLCVSLSILSPLTSLVAFSLSVRSVSPYFSRFPGLLVIYIISGVLGVALMAAAVFAGVRLWQVRPGAVRTVKAVLLAYVAYQLLDAVLPFLAGLPTATNQALVLPAIANFARGMLYPAIWYSYLMRSKRVRATYPAEFAPPAEQAPQPDAPEVGAQ